ncbi:RNA polymerase sigma factor [Bacteroidota bacterium]
MREANKNSINIHQKLLDECRKGKPKAQLAIYKLYYKAMFNTSLRIVRERSEAEDIMQESFLSAFNKLEFFREDVTFGQWLKKIVINKSIDSLKKKKIQFQSIEEHPDIVSLKDTDTQTNSSEKGKIKQIREAIPKLPDGYRTILSLYLLEGYDHDEISSILDITPSTSRSQYLRAKKRLLKIIEKEN